MNIRWGKMLGKIFWTVIFFIFINNPASPLSIPVFWHDSFYWAPIFRADYLTFYQILFSIFLLADLLVSILECIFTDVEKHLEIAHELVSLAEWVVIQNIPKAAVNLAESKLDQIYPVAFWIITVIMFFTVVGVVMKVLRLSTARPKMIKPK